MTQRPYVILATPSFEGRPVREYFVSIMDTVRLFFNHEIDFVCINQPGDPYLGKVRNTLVSLMLTDHPRATDFFFLDDDIGWPAEKVIEFLMRPEDVIVGVYPKKTDELEWPVTLALVDGKPVERNGLFLANLVPTGFMRIKRHVIEKMAINSSRYHHSPKAGIQKVCWNIFHAGMIDYEVEKLRKADLDSLSREAAIAHLKRAVGLVPGNEIGEFWGEDYWFAERWRQLGGEVWVDPNIKFTHRGSKAWEANMWDSLKGGQK